MLGSCCKLTAEQYAAEPAPGWSSVRPSIVHIDVVTEGWPNCGPFPVIQFPHSKSRAYAVPFNGLYKKVPATVDGNGGGHPGRFPIQLSSFFD
jgi:hypothetical protein